MNYASLVNSGVLSQPMYVPGKPIAEVALEYNLDIASIDKLASNGFGPSPLAIQAIQEASNDVHLYPDGACTDIKRSLAQLHNLEADNFIFGNGSNEIIELLGHTFLKPGVNVVVGSHSFIVYRLVAQLFGAQTVEVPMKEFAHDLEAMLSAIDENTRMVFVASPNNPTGMANTEAELIQFIDQLQNMFYFVLMKPMLNT